MHDRRSRNRWVIPSVLGLVLTVVVSGCLGGSRSENEAGDNKAPVADLKAEKRNGYMTEAFTFDASASKDDDGEIREYKFDFGDGTPPMVISQRSDAEKVQHAYAQGGQYTVTLTVTDDGGENTGALASTDATTVGVNHRQPIPEHVIYAPPSEQAPAARDIITFPVRQDADRVEAQIDLRNAAPLGSSEVILRLKDATNKTVDEERLTLSGTTTNSRTLTGEMLKEGSWSVEVEPVSGGTTVGGEIRVFYDKDLPGDS